VSHPAEQPLFPPEPLMLSLSEFLSLATAVAMLTAAQASAAPQQQADQFAVLQSQFQQQQLPALQKFCLDCHSTTAQQGDLDLEQFRSVADIRRNPVPWQRAVQQLDQQEMPPQEADHQPSPDERRNLRNWIQAVLDADARANAEIPAP
jgi:Planctomycete cytochrome C